MIRISPIETDDDLEAIRELLVEYADSLGFDLCFQNFEEELADLPSDYAAPEGCLLLAEYNGQVAGCVAVRKLSKSVCEMKRLYVKPEFRGLKIGRELAERVIEQARRIGYERMRIHTITALERANRLYKSLGFNEIDPYEYIPREDAVFMELKLE